MIETEVYEPDKFDPYKRVYYRSYGRVIRIASLDDNGNIVKDFLYEYNDDKLVDCIVQYSKDHTTITGVKNFYYYENSERIKSTEQYKFENNKKIRTEKAVHEYNDTDRTCTVTIYRESDEPEGYELYGYKKGDDFMSLMGCYNMKNEKISCFDLSKISFPK